MHCTTFLKAAKTVSGKDGNSCESRKVENKNGWKQSYINGLSQNFSPKLKSTIICNRCNFETWNISSSKTIYRIRWQWKLLRLKYWVKKQNTANWNIERKKSKFEGDITIKGFKKIVRCEMFRAECFNMQKIMNWFKLCMCQELSCWWHNAVCVRKYPERWIESLGYILQSGNYKVNLRLERHTVGHALFFSHKLSKTIHFYF